MKIWKDKRMYVIATGMAVIATLITTTGEAGYIDPGSESDPIVSKTYVDKKVNDLKQSLDIILQKTTKDIESIKESNKNNVGENVQGVSEAFKVIELKKGEIIMADESSEIIVRSGVVHAIGSKNGGLSDITEGIDLQTGQQIKSNHLLIIPRSDGRGIEVKSNDTFVMIKGKYKIN